jgi:hypothetical protein
MVEETVTASGPKGGTTRRGRSTGDGAARGRRAALAREHRRRPCSEEPLKIPIALGLFPGSLSPCMAWTAKFGTITVTGKERKLKEGYHIGYLDIPTGHLWLTLGGQGIAPCAPFQVETDFSVCMSRACCGSPIDAHPHGRRISAIQHLLGRGGLQWCIQQQCRSYPA